MGAGMSQYQNKNSESPYESKRKEVLSSIDDAYNNHANTYYSIIDKKKMNTASIKDKVRMNKSMDNMNNQVRVNKNTKYYENTLLSMSRNVDPDIGLKILLNKNAIEERSTQTMALQSIIQQIKESYRRQCISYWVYLIFIVTLVIASYLLHNIVYVHTM